MTNLEKLRYITDDKDKLVKWLETFTWNNFDASTEKEQIEEFLDNKYADDWDDGEGIWFTSDVTTGEVVESVIDPDSDTVVSMNKKAEELGDTFVTSRISQDELKRLYDRYKTSNIKTEEEIKERMHNLSIKIEKECFKGFPDQRVVDSYKYRIDELYWVLGGEIWT